jgi:pyruvate dehydrogenase E2 component (dihydrolipoamide acetyltransferase)
LQKGDELMAEELFIPKLGQTVEEVTLLNWLVKDGEKVKQGQEVLEVETDKAVFNVEAVDDGFIHFGPFKTGEVVPVLTVVAIIGEKDEAFKLSKPADNSDKAGSVETPISQKVESKPFITGQNADSGRVFASPRAKKLALDNDVDLYQIKPTGGNGVRVTEKDVIQYLAQEIKISPLAKRMAEDARIDPRSIQPTGLHGEITKADIELALAGKSTGAQAVVPASQPVQPALPDMRISETQPLIGVRRVVAQRMGMSAQTTARVTLLMDVDATDFVALREKLKAEKETEWGFAAGYNELIAKACAIALRRFPYMNARLNGNVIERLADVNIGIAVDADAGLYVPVIKNIDQKDLQTVSKEFRQRVQEIRSNKILPENLSGGTFTITNLGMYDVDGFTPVINLPEAAILGVGRIAPKPVVVNDQVVIRKMMTLSLAFDHRLTDGAPAAKFLQYVKELIEQPNEAALTK